MTRCTRGALTALLLTMACLLPPSNATAGMVHFVDGRVVFTAAPGESNAIRVGEGRDLGATLTIVDSGAPITVSGSACAVVTANRVECPEPAGTALPVTILAGDGADSIAAGAYGSPNLSRDYKLDGGAGNDAISMSSQSNIDGEVVAGDGDDSVLINENGASGSPIVHAGAGNDKVDLRGNSAARVYGGQGDDQITCGCMYFWLGPQAVRLEGGEGDDSYSVSMWTAIPDRAGSLIVAGPGTDTLRLLNTISFPTTFRFDQCPLCVERVFGTQFDDTLIGDEQAQEISGGAYHDTIDGGGGSDVLDGQEGDDTIDAQDGVADVVRCGTGTDSVTADQVDDVGADCENVTRVGAAPDTTKPTCGTLIVRRKGSGGKDEADVTVSDAGGVQSITNFTVANGTFSIPAFTAGTGSVTVTAVKTVQGQLTRFSFDVTDMAGNTVHCR